MSKIREMEVSQEILKAKKEIVQPIFKAWRGLISEKSDKRRKLQQRLRQEQKKLREDEKKSMIRRMMQVTFDGWKLKSAVWKAERLEEEEIKLRTEEQRKEQHRLEVQKSIARRASRMPPHSPVAVNRRATTSRKLSEASFGSASFVGTAQNTPCNGGGALVPPARRRQVDPVPQAPSGPAKGGRTPRSPRVRLAHASAPVLSSPPAAESFFPNNTVHEDVNNFGGSCFLPPPFKPAISSGALGKGIAIDDQFASLEGRRQHNQQYNNMNRKEKEARAATTVPQARFRTNQGVLKQAARSHLEANSIALLNKQKLQKICRNIILPHHMKEMKKIQKVYEERQQSLEQAMKQQAHYHRILLAKYEC